MTTQEIAKKIVEYNKTGEYEKAHRELYADDAISVEPVESEHFEKETRGLKNIIEKGKKFVQMVKEVHSVSVSEPLIAGNAIAIESTMDVTMHEGGRMKMGELLVYEVKDGKIVAERFFM